MTNSKSFLGAATVALGLLSAPLAQAGTVTSFSTVTIPSTFSTATTLGPQSVVIGFSNTLTASRPLNLRLAVTGASFVTTSTPTLTLAGTSGLDAAVICTTTNGLDALVVQCTPTGGSQITGVTIGELKYTNATALNTVGGSIKLSGTLTAPSIGSFEDVASKEVVVRTTTSGGSSSGAVGNILRQGAAYSSAQTSAISLVRFYNSGTTAGTVTVTLANYLTGDTLTQWTSPSIAAGNAPQ